MSRGFTLIELIIIVCFLSIVSVLILVGVHSCVGSSSDLDFMFVNDKELKLVTDPATGVTSECYREFTGNWNCRLVKTNLPTRNVPVEHP